jgi:hypothetical protein
LRIDQTDPATYGAYTARQFLATAEAHPKYRDGMTKRPSTSSIKITYFDTAGEFQMVGVREIFCRMDGDALVLTHFENAEGAKVTELPIADPLLDEDDHADRFHELALAELGEVDSSSPDETEPEPEPEEPQPAPEPVRERRLPTGPLRKYGEAAAPAPAPASTPAADTLQTPPVPEPARPGPAAMPPVTMAPRATGAVPAGQAIRVLNEAEAASLRALIEAKAGQTRWASSLLMQTAERYPSDRKLQNEHLANLLRLSLDESRAEYRTPLGTALRAILEEVHAYKAGVLDRDPLKAEKVALLPFARAALAPTGVDDSLPKTVSGVAQRTPAQVLAKLQDPKLARATRVKYLLEVVPEMIETWRPDKESGRSDGANENSPAIVRRLFAVANEQRQQRKFIDNGSAFKKANERYAGLESKLPKASAADDS